LLTRLLFNKAGLYALFTARKWLTRWYVRQKQKKKPTLATKNYE
jgi:hypothetical protein